MTDILIDIQVASKISSVGIPPIGSFPLPCGKCINTAVKRDKWWIRNTLCTNQMPAGGSACLASPQEPSVYLVYLCTSRHYCYTELRHNLFASIIGSISIFNNKMHWMHNIANKHGAAECILTVGDEYNFYLSGVASSAVCQLALSHLHFHYVRQSYFPVWLSLYPAPFVVL